MLMMLHPMELAELRASVWFSCIVKTFSLPLLMALSSTVLGTDVLISLLHAHTHNYIHKVHVYVAMGIHAHTHISVLHSILKGFFMGGGGGCREFAPSEIGLL